MNRKYLWLILIAWVILATSCAGSGQYTAKAIDTNPDSICPS